MPLPPIDVSVVIPTFDEFGNVEPLVRRLADALRGVRAEIIFVDDSSDGTDAEVRRVAELPEFGGLPITVVHRARADGGLSGAVLVGMRLARAPLCVVMDGDLQHPPELVPRLLDTYRGASGRGGVDIVVASRYVPESSAAGLADVFRGFVSRGTTRLTKALFPDRLAGCSDPMTGFFLVRLAGLDLEALRPRGFKILLEILARQQLRVTEIPFEFATRHAGRSKASLRQGLRFVTQLLVLRFGRG